MKHTPTPDQAAEAVSIAFITTVAAIKSDSRKTEAVEPREVWTYLLRVRCLLRVEEVATIVGYGLRYTKKVIQNVRERARVDTDFAARIWEAERILLTPPSNEKKEEQWRDMKGQEGYVKVREIKD